LEPWFGIDYISQPFAALCRLGPFNLSTLSGKALALCPLSLSLPWHGSAAKVIGGLPIRYWYTYPSTSYYCLSIYYAYPPLRPARSARSGLPLPKCGPLALSVFLFCSGVLCMQMAKHISYGCPVRSFNGLRNTYVVGRIGSMLGSQVVRSADITSRLIEHHFRDLSVVTVAT
jgi:hypothetical protein